MNHFKHRVRKLCAHRRRPSLDDGGPVLRRMKIVSQVNTKFLFPLKEEASHHNHYCLFSILTNSVTIPSYGASSYQLRRAIRKDLGQFVLHSCSDRQKVKMQHL